MANGFALGGAASGAQSVFDAARQRDAQQIVKEEAEFGQRLKIQKEIAEDVSRGRTEVFALIDQMRQAGASREKIMEVVQPLISEGALVTEKLGGLGFEGADPQEFLQAAKARIDAPFQSVEAQTIEKGSAEIRAKLAQRDLLLKEGGFTEEAANLAVGLVKPGDARMQFKQGQEDKKAQDAKVEDQRSRTNAALDAQDTFRDIVHKIKKIVGSGGQLEESFLPSTGVIGFLTEDFPFLSGGQLKTLINPLKARLGFEEIKKLKAASPTGASGLGQIAVVELEFLQQVVAKLDPGLPEKQLKQNLNDVLRSFARFTTIQELHAEGKDFNEWTFNEDGTAIPGGVDRLDKHIRALTEQRVTEAEASMKKPLPTKTPKVPVRLAPGERTTIDGFSVQRAPQ